MDDTADTGAPQGASVMGGRAQAPRLGLGLGLNKFRRADLLQAQQQGGAFMDQFNRRHPGIQNRIERGIERGGERGEALQTFMDTGATPTGAEVRLGPRPPNPARVEAREALQSARGEMREGVQGAREAGRESVMAARQAARPAVQAARQNLRELRRGGR